MRKCLFALCLCRVRVWPAAVAVKAPLGTAVERLPDGGSVSLTLSGVKQPYRNISHSSGLSGSSLNLSRKPPLKTTMEEVGFFLVVEMTPEPWKHCRLLYSLSQVMVIKKQIHKSLLSRTELLETREGTETHIRKIFQKNIIS